MKIPALSRFRGGQRTRDLLMAGRPPYDVHEIGAWSYGNPRVLGWKSGGRLVIGKYCSIAGGVTILLGGEHRTDFVSTYPFGEFLAPDLGSRHEHTKGDVLIGSDVWIGAEATILSGVTIGNGAVIAAGALISKSVGPYEIWGGNPGRLIRTRFPHDEVAALLRIAWWDWPDEKVRSEAPLLMSCNLDRFIAHHDRLREVQSRNSGDLPE